MFNNYTRFILKVLLLGLGLVQTLYLGLFFLKQSPQLQAQAIRKINTQLASHGISLSTQKLSYNLRTAEIECAELKLFDKRYQSPLFEAKKCTGKINFFGLFLPNIPTLAHLEILEGKLTLPAEISPLAIPWVLADKLNASIGISQNTLAIKSMHAKCCDIACFFEGHLDLSKLTLERAGQSPLKDNALSLNPLHTLLQDLGQEGTAQKLAILKQFEEPTLAVQCLGDTLKAQFTAKKFIYGNTLLKKLLAQAALFLPLTPETACTLGFKTRSIATEYGTAEQSLGSFIYQPSKNHLKGGALFLQSLQIKGPELKLGTAFAKIHSHIKDSWYGSLGFKAQTNTASSTFAWQQPQRQLLLENICLSLNHRSPPWNLPQYIPAIIAEFENGQTDFLGDALLIASSDHFNLAQLKGSIYSKGLDHPAFFINRLYSTVEKLNKDYQVKRCSVHSQGYRANGSLFYSAENSALRAWIQGSLAPNLLNPFFKPWWQSFWDPFSFQQAYPYTDIDIQPHHMLGSIQAKNFAYKGNLFDEAKLTLEYTPKSFIINDLAAQTNQGILTGSYSHTYGSKNGAETISKRSFNLKSTLTQPYWTAFLEGTPIQKALEGFEWTVGPVVKLTGTVGENTPNTRENLQIHFSHPAALKYYSISLQALQLEAQYTQSQLSIPGIHYMLAKGKGQGSAVIQWNSNPTAPAILSFQTKLQEANPDEMLRSLTQISPENTQQHNPQPSQTHYGGKLYTQLQAQGFLNDVKSFSGSGHLSLEKADLGEVHLFGILSRMLSLTPLRLGSSKLVGAESDFSIRHGGVIHFPNALIYGPNLAISGLGNYYIPNNSIDFLMKIFTPKGSKLFPVSIPILSSIPNLLTTPLTEALEIRVHGPANDPSYSFSLGFANKNIPRPK